MRRVGGTGLIGRLPPTDRIMGELHAKPLIGMLTVEFLFGERKAKVRTVGEENAVGGINRPDPFRVVLYATVRMKTLDQFAMPQFDLCKAGRPGQAENGEGMLQIGKGHVTTIARVTR